MPGRAFYNWAAWSAAAGTGAALLWRVKPPWVRLPVLEMLPNGSCRSVLIVPRLNRETARQPVIDAARAGQALDPAAAREIRVIEYEIGGRAGNGKNETVTLITTITSPAAASAAALAAAYHQRWEHETGNQQLKTYLRSPGRVLRSGSPGLVRQEIWGYPLAHCAISALICDAATAAGVDPDRVKFRRTLRIVRRRVADPAFPPEHARAVLARVMADITRPANLNPARRHRSYPRAVKRARHNAYRLKRRGETGTTHDRQPAITLRIPSPRPAQASKIKIS